MKLATRCIPLGTLPYDSIESTTRMAAKLFSKLPFLPVLPKVSEEDSVVNYTLEGIPGVKIKDGEIVLKTSSTSYKQAMAKLDKAFNNPDSCNLEHFSIKAAFMEKYFQMIKKFKSPNAVINLLGPFTISQILNSIAEEQILADKSYRKLFIQAVCVKALWVIEKIKEVNPNTVPIIMLEEPRLGQLGVLKRENEEITSELVVAMFTRVVEKIKEAGAIVGVQCFEKCDWQVPISAGVDIISFDAYNNPNNLCIIPEQISEFIERGGKINWGIVPVMTESIVKELNIDYLSSRLFSTMQGLILAGVPAKNVYDSALVSIQGNVDKLPIIFAEKAIILSTQLAQKIPVVA